MQRPGSGSALGSDGAASDISAGVSTHGPPHSAGILSATSQSGVGSGSVGGGGGVGSFCAVGGMVSTDTAAMSSSQTAALRNGSGTSQPSPVVMRRISKGSPKQDRNTANRSPFKSLPNNNTGILLHDSSGNVTPISNSQLDDDSSLQGLPPGCGVAPPSGTAAAGSAVNGHTTNNTPCDRGGLDPLLDSPVFKGHRSKSEGKLTGSNWTEKPAGSTPQSAAKLSKRESLKVQKRHYRREKKRAAKEMLSTLKDPSVIVMADWLKVRGSLKSWTKLWCVLKPGLLVLYKSHKQKTGQWVGTILLNTTELIERPSKKDGFCYKLYHPLDQSIWATKGPKGESIGAITQPLPYSHLIFRATSEAAGKCWMDALELALRCSSILMRSLAGSKDDDPRDPTSLDTSSLMGVEEEGENDRYLNAPLRLNNSDMNESDCEKHFKGVCLDDEKTDREGEQEKSDSDSERSEDEEKDIYDDNLQPLETPYIPNTSEELGQQGDAQQTSELAEENKSIIWALLKQVRPGMDLSKVVLPTFILEPRSFLDKLSDYYYHAHFLSDAVVEEDPFTRLKIITKWYIAGFYKKPKGPKKPYNSILGETFRCYWKHPKTNSRTFYIAEQISHHPPITAFYITNRQDGFSASGSILAKSKFYGNSVSAIMDGVGCLTLLKRGEDYHINIPYAHCKGIILGTFTMELGGKVNIECEKTGYRAELEFKLKPFLGSGEASNRIVGKLKLGNETLATLDGHWDQEVFIKDKATGETESFWNPTPDMKSMRLRRYTVPMEHQEETESERLWQHVTTAINNNDQIGATNEKFILEETQRNATRERKAKMIEHAPRLFERDELTGEWIYKYADLRPWDGMNDLLQYEHDYMIQTKTRHRTPIVRTMSITNVEESAKKKHPTRLTSLRLKRAVHKGSSSASVRRQESESSTADADQRSYESSDSADDLGGCRQTSGSLSSNQLQRILQPILESQSKNTDELNKIQTQLTTLQRSLYHQKKQSESGGGGGFTLRDVMIVAFLLAWQLVVVMWLK